MSVCGTADTGLCASYEQARSRLVSSSVLDVVRGPRATLRTEPAGCNRSGGLVRRRSRARTSPPPRPRCGAVAAAPLARCWSEPAGGGGRTRGGRSRGPSVGACGGSRRRPSRCRQTRLNASRRRSAPGRGSTGGRRRAGARTAPGRSSGGRGTDSRGPS